MKFCKVNIQRKNKAIEPIWINCSNSEIEVKYSESVDFIDQVLLSVVAIHLVY